MKKLKMKKQILISQLLLLFVLSSCDQKKFKPDLYPVSLKEKWGYIDKTGKYIIIPQYSYADFFIDGLALVANDDEKFGFINEKGEYVIAATYENASNFSEDLACVVPENGAIQYINKKGNVVFELADALYAGNFHNGLAKVKIGDKWGFVDKKGKMKIAPQYDRVMDFTEGRAAVYKFIKDPITNKIVDALWGYINKNGKTVIDFKYKDIAPFNESSALVSTDGAKYGYIDLNGKNIIAEKYEEATAFYKGIAAFKSENLWGFINSRGKVIINPQYNEVQFALVNGLIAVKNGEKWGYIDEEGNYVIKPQFNSVTNFIGDIAMVDTSGKVGLIDKKGKFVATPQFDNVLNRVDYIIYGIGYSFGAVESEKFNKPEKIAYKFLYHLNEKHYNEARKLGTKNTINTVNYLENENKISGLQNQEADELSISDIVCSVHNDTAEYSYTKLAKVHKLRLIKKNINWLVDMTQDEYLIDNSSVSISVNN